MNVLLISQCNKRALTESRRILDQFAERRGERTWQTPITQEGLDTLRRLLKKTARKNTAVACHWIRGLDHSELIWVVGDAARFNAQGAVPTNTTRRNVLRQRDENDWHTGEDIALLTGLSALLHDLGKASFAFQEMLRGNSVGKNQYRHEWVSLRLFEAFVGDDDDAKWLARLAAPTAADDSCWLGRLMCDGLTPAVELTQPFARMSAKAPLAQAIGWLVLTHHRLPVLARQSDGSPAPFQIGQLNKVLENIDSSWNEKPSSDDRGTIEPYWRFPHGLPVTTELWQQRAARLAQRLLALQNKPGKGNWLANPYVMHVSRLCLMLADHHYSSLVDKTKRVKGQDGYALYANTTGAAGQFNQTLDEHLLGVAQHSGEVTHALPRFEHHLPRLARHNRLRKRSDDERFRWQDKAFDTASTLREHSMRQGAFIVNMASTGCGKTLANARIMFALSDPVQGMRCAFAMGLRTLTLQTGRAFRDLLKLGEDDLAIRVGGSASRELFKHYERQAEVSGSASRQALLDEDGYVSFEGNHESHPLLRRVMNDPQVNSLLAAPLLVCTIDHLTPATESQRGGRQIAPMLRLMSGDLVLDEPDDFDISDLPALTRLVHWAGLLGARVLLSSATLPPALVRGLFEAYRNGRGHFQINRSDRPNGAARPPEVCCAWVDEFHQSQADCTDGLAFDFSHQAFVAKRHGRLGLEPVRRRSALLPLPLERMPEEELPGRFAELVRDAAFDLHRGHHSTDPVSGKLVSFGLVRMANIEPLYDVALALYKLGARDGYRIHLCTYHSQFPLLLRSAIERRLDQALNRREPDAVFRLPDIRERIDAHAEADHLFIVLGSPVTEVGRDHDYDWAVVEPSSMRSLIQLAGRVRRHRSGERETPNLMLFNTNLRHCRQPDQPAFCKPGFESADFRLQNHHLDTLLAVHERAAIDARPRIVSAAPDKLQPGYRLVDLEHARMGHTMLVASPVVAASGRYTRRAEQAPAALNAASWWNLPPADALLTGLLPQQQPFRRKDGIEQIDLVLVPDEDATDHRLRQYLESPEAQVATVEVEPSRDHRLPAGVLEGFGIRPWGETDYMQALADLASELRMSVTECAWRFGTVTLPANEGGWRFHPALGFAKWR